MNFLSLPPEIRDHIYALLLRPENNRSTLEDGYIYYNYAQSLPVTLVNRQIRIEALSIFHKLNTFITIETPWQEALPKIVEEGRVPVIVSGEAAEYFDAWTMLATIDMPQFNLDENDKRRFVIHVDDLPAFCQTWMYSDLSYPGLNPHLELRLRVQRPWHAEGDEEEVEMPRKLQEKLLLPFGVVKDLSRYRLVQSVRLGGVPLIAAGEVQDELDRRRRIPHESPETCLRKATAYKDQGNVALRLGRYDEALEMYRLAWLAMHIVVTGRERHVHGDAWFNIELREEPFKGFAGHSIRLALRIKLVANTVALYLKMEQWDEAIFWGMRTIGMMRQAIGLGEGQEAQQPQDEAILDFVGAADMGKIYFRTAMALKALDRILEARPLLKVAQVYLPHDAKVREEVVAAAPRLG